MQHTPTKDWLVRTQGGEILGPFTESELLSALRDSRFTHEDEISKTGGNWRSAQTLQGREAEELTATHTKTQHPTTGSLTITPTPALQLAANDSPYSPPAPAKEPEISVVPEIEASLPTTKQRWFHVGVAVGFVSLVWALVLKMKVPVNGSPSTTKSVAAGSTLLGGDTPFLREIDFLIRTGQYSAAHQRLMKFHQTHPSKTDIGHLVPYAATLILEGEGLGRAKKLLDQALSSPIATAEQRAHAHHWLGYLLLSEGEGDMGENHFLEALQLNPKDAASRFNLGCAYLRQKKAQQALDYLQLAELEAPNLWLIHIYKGRAKRALGMTEEARQAFKRAIETAPDRWIAYLYYAVFLKANHEIELAQEVLRVMLTRDPRFEHESPAPLGFFQEDIPYADYLETYEDIMAKSSAEDRELGRLYIGFLMSGAQGAEAQKILAMGGEKASLMAQVFGLKVGLEKGDHGEPLRVATARLPRSLKKFGYYAYVLRGEALTRLGQFSEAAADLRTAIQLEPLSATARWGLINLLRTQRQNSQTEEEIKQLLNLDPNYIPALKTLSSTSGD